MLSNPKKGLKLKVSRSMEFTVQTDSGEILPATCEPGQAFTYASEDMHNDMYNISTAKCNQPTNQPGLRQCQHDF
jgi:hypothetical protein